MLQKEQSLLEPTRKCPELFSDYFYLGYLWLEQDFCFLGEEIITSRSELGVP